MLWVEVFTVFVLCHLGGDFLVQTNWMARNKRGGLGRNPEPRRALLSHGASYTLAFVPALVWLGGDLDTWTLVGLAALVGVPHTLQDDGRVVSAYLRRVKGLDVTEVPIVSLIVDQTLHLLALFAVALIAGS